MSKADVARQLRHPVAQREFDQLPLATTTLAAASWWNLRWKAFAAPEHLFYSSASGRLTPASAAVPCLYLSPSERTSFFELYGDQLHLDREAGRTPRIEANDFIDRVYLQVEMPELTIADLTSGKAIQDIHLDLGTLYAADPQYPRAFAEAILHHPANVDGILYESRHTRERCVVVWALRCPELAAARFAVAGNLADRCTLHGSIATLFETTIQVVA